MTCYIRAFIGYYQVSDIFKISDTYERKLSFRLRRHRLGVGFPQFDKKESLVTKLKRIERKV